MRRSLFSILLLCAAVHCLTTAPSFFVPFNTSNDNLLYPNDDGYSTSIPFYFKFFGNDNSNAYVNTNGLISFAGPVSTFTPTGLQTVSYPMISAFWTDIDTRGDSTNPELNKLWYRVETDPTQINAVAATVRNRLYLAYTPSATQMLVATYYRVGYFSSKTDLLNTFQIVLMSDSRNASFVMLNYGEMQFYKNSGATIGASVGFSAGDYTNYVTLPNSNTPQIVDLQSTSNVGVPGQWIFAVGTDDFSCCFVNYPGEPSLVFEEGVPENVTILSGTAIPVAPTIIGKTLCTASNSTIVPTETSEFNDGEEIITRTWTVADTCGKIATFTQVIRIINVIPVFTIPVSKYGMFNYTQPFNTENIDAPLVTRSHMYNTAYYTTNHTFSQGSTFPGWFSNRDTYRYDNGHQRDRNVLFLYGTDEETERSLGGSAADGEALVIAVAFQNFYTTSVQELLVSYTGEQWRRTSSPLNSTLLFQYRVVPAFVEGDCCGQSSENWTTVESLSFTSPVPNNMDDFSYSRLDGNRAFARREKSDILTVTVHPDEILYLRWIMIGDGGLDHYLSIEDFGIEFDFEFPSVPITPSNTIYNETFDIMSHDESEDHEFNSGMAPVYAWHSNIDTYRASYGRGRRSSNRTLIYSYGLTNETDRAIGGSCEQDGNFTIAVAFRNFNSQNISKAIVEYTGEEWRRDVSRNQTIMEFEYAVDTTATEGLCCNDVLVWTRVPSLDFTSPRVNLLADFSYSWLNGNLPANRRVIGPVTVNDMNVGYKDILYFRWRITSAHSENHFLSVDDFNVSFEFM